MLRFHLEPGKSKTVLQNLPLFVALVAILAWSLLGATALLKTSVAALTDYKTPYGHSNVAGDAGTPLSRHVVIVVISGLRQDASEQLTNLNGLRRQGADRVVEAGPPAYSLPAWATIGTGAQPEQHGQTSDLHAYAIQMDSIFSAAARSGLTRALAGAADWQKLYDGQFTSASTDRGSEDAIESTSEAHANDNFAETNALNVLHSNSPNLLVVQFSEAESAAQESGALSPAYSDALQIIDARLGRLLASIDLGMTTVLVTTDHGLIDHGGFGGLEDAVLKVPLVVAGQGVKPGKYDLAMQADIAPTTAVLLGLSIPRDSQGDVLFDMLDMNVASKAKRAVDWAEQAVARDTQITTFIGVGSIEHQQLAEARSALAKGDYETAITAAQTEVQSTRELVLALREGRIQQERLMRTPGLFVLLIPIMLYGWWIAKRQWRLKLPLVGALVYFAVFYGLFFASGNSLSLSSFNASVGIVSSLTTLTLEAGISLLMAAVSVGLLSGGRNNKETALAALNAGIFIAAGLWFQIAAFYWLYDFTWPWFLPDLTRIFVYYLAIAQSGSFMPSNFPLPFILILPLLAVGTRNVLSRLRHPFVSTG